MKTFNRTLIAAALGLALSGFAFANDPEVTPPADPADTTMTTPDVPVAETEVTFADLDTDADGYVSQADIPAEHELALQFSTADSDKDSRLSQAEFDAFAGSLEEDEIGE